jgi:hypothetical protein
MIDDLKITLSAINIDGPQGVLGRAGFTAVRSDSFLPITGIMEFDRADLNVLESEGLLGDVILHEIGHVIGIGTLWEHLNVVDFSSRTNPIYIGAEGVAAYSELLGHPVDSVPVANTGGGGTYGGHWRESSLQNELMTGYINRGANPFSLLSVASLSDLGYDVDRLRADPFFPAVQALLGGHIHKDEEEHTFGDLIPLPIEDVIVVAVP